MLGTFRDETLCNNSTRHRNHRNMRVLIVGGGVGGLCLANGLKKAGIDVVIFERQASPSESLAGHGIHVDANGRHALWNCLQPADWDRFNTISTAAGTQIFFRDTKLRLLAERNDAELSGKPVCDTEAWNRPTGASRHSPSRTDFGHLGCNTLEQDFRILRTIGGRAHAFILR